MYGRRELGDLGADRAADDESEAGIAESIEGKPERDRENLSRSHVGRLDEQSAVEDKNGFFSKPLVAGANGIIGPLGKL